MAITHPLLYMAPQAAAPRARSATMPTTGSPPWRRWARTPDEVGPHLYPSRETAALTQLDGLMERTVSASGGS